MPQVPTPLIRLLFSCLEEVGLTPSWGIGMRTRRLLALVPVLIGCSAIWAQGPTLVVSGTGGTTHDFTGSYYGDHGGTPFTISGARQVFCVNGRTFSRSPSLVD